MDRPIGILYEHPLWFEPLFAELYDVNALSNFVANAPDVIGFDPFVDLVDFLLERAERPLALNA